jgi:hypothetical protein
VDVQIALGVLQAVAILLPLTGVFIRLTIGDAVAVSEAERGQQLGVAGVVGFLLSAVGITAAVTVRAAATDRLLQAALLLFSGAFLLVAVFIVNLVADQAVDDPEPAITPRVPATYRPRQRCWYAQYAAGDTG